MQYPHMTVILTQFQTHIQLICQLYSTIHIVLINSLNDMIMFQSHVLLFCLTHKAYHVVLRLFMIICYMYTVLYVNLNLLNYC